MFARFYFTSLDNRTNNLYYNCGIWDVMLVKSFPHFHHDWAEDDVRKKSSVVIESWWWMHHPQFMWLFIEYVSRQPARDQVHHDVKPTLAALRRSQTSDIWQCLFCSRHFVFFLGSVVWYLALLQSIWGDMDPHVNKEFSLTILFW